MNARDHGVLAFLAVLAAWIWLRDLNWLELAGDTLPALAALPVFVWMARPWSFATGPSRPLPAGHLGAASVCLVGGVLADVTFLLALAWTLMLRAWFVTRVDQRGRGFPGAGLFVLTLLAFPWVANDLNVLGWTFRLSGAAVAERALSALQFDVVRYGTFLQVGGEMISVEAACSGMNGLQAMLIAGTALACLHLTATGLFWWNLPVLFVAAWTANTLRIVMLSLFQVQNHPAFRSDLIHGLTGWLTLSLAFGLCWFLFAWQASRTGTAEQPCPSPSRT